MEEVPLLDLIITDNKGFVGNVKIKGCLGKLEALNSIRAGTAIFKYLRRLQWYKSLGEKKDLRKLVNIQESPSPSSRAVHPKELKARQKKPGDLWRLRQEAYRGWKQGWVSWEEYRNTVQPFRDTVTKAKAQQDLNLGKMRDGNMYNHFSIIHSFFLMASQKLEKDNVVSHSNHHENLERSPPLSLHEGLHNLSSA